MATTLREFDSWHPANFDADRAVAIALAAEAAGREVDARIGNSDGASANAGRRSASTPIRTASSAPSAAPRTASAAR
jgi:predicted Zn-dependent protease